MKLKKLSIKNLRGLQNIEFNNHGFTTLIGKNNCGKSSVLRAIELLCSGAKPDTEEFYLRNNEKIEIVVEFDEIKEWERNNSAISGLIYNNLLKLKYSACIDSEDEKKKCEVEYFAYKKQETIIGWSENWGGTDSNIKTIANTLNINGTNFKTLANKEKIKQFIREIRPELISYGEEQWTNDSISFNNSLQQAIPKIIIIPAVKDAVDESKYSKTTKSAFGELMRKLILPQIQAEQHYKDIQIAIQALTNKIHSEEGISGINNINEKLSTRLSRLINAKANIRFENPEIDTIISSSVGLRITDGNHDTPIGLQGHGLQRTLIFSLLELVAENDAVINAENSRSTIILFEEPELYLHPQMLRKLKAILNTIAESDNWQIVCTTHSPVFINVADNPESLIILSKNLNGLIKMNQLKESPFENSEIGKMERDALRAALNFHPTVCEVFFANKVILVEGDTEMAIFKHCSSLLEFCQVDPFKALDCTIVSCGGKWTIPAIARLLKAFKIVFKIVHDLDMHGKTLEEAENLPAIHPYKVNGRIALTCNPESIFINTDTIEDLWGGTKSNKPYNAIKSIEKLVADKNVPNNLQKLIAFVFADCFTTN